MDASAGEQPQPSGSSASEKQPTVCWGELVGLLTGLTQAISAQTEAIDRLASSNEALVDALYQDGEAQEGEEPTHYLSGKPIQ